MKKSKVDNHNCRKRLMSELKRVNAKVKEVEEKLEK